MKYIIVGRSGSGKSELAARLENKGLKILKTYTTRNPRNETDAKKYNFIQPNEVKHFKDRMLQTEFFGATYFARKSDILTADAMILEPEGFYEIIKAFPNIQFALLYIQPEKSEIADARAVSRADDPEAAMADIKKRRAGEDERFSPLEQKIEQDTLKGQNCIYQTHTNDYQSESLDKLAANMVGALRKHNNFVKILEQLVALGALKTEDGRKIQIMDEADEPILVSLDLFAQIFINDDESFGYIMRSWLTHDISFKIPSELAPDILFAQSMPDPET